jgi:GMP synthase-like glutamine amidotransferase
MSEVLILQNSKNEGLSGLGRLLKEDGFVTKIIFAQKENIPKQHFSALIILGAPESANDDLPYLKNEIDLIREYVEKDIPILGICLGSQLIAKAFGGKVYRGNKKEIGIYRDVEFDNQTKSNLFSGIKSPATVFHWHGDTFELPSNAMRLAHSINYQNQALQIGSAIGVQFHLEVDEETVRLWLDKSKNELSRIPFIDPNTIRKEIPESIQEIQKNLQIFYHNFKAEFNL